MRQRIAIVVLGFALGYAAKWIFGEANAPPAGKPAQTKAAVAPVDAPNSDS